MNSKVGSLYNISSPQISIPSKIFNKLEERTVVPISVSEQQQFPWWVIVKNNCSNSTYYFGPFTQLQQAFLFYTDYKEDLDRQEEEEINIVIKQLNPENLTVLCLPE